MLENLGEIKEHTEATIKIRNKIIDYVCSSVLNRDKAIKKEEITYRYSRSCLIVAIFLICLTFCYINQNQIL